MRFCPECAAVVPGDAAFCPTCGAALEEAASEAAVAEVSAGAIDDIDSLRRELADSLAPQYEILKLLGQGGMGAVFLAREPAIRRLVAVKILAPRLAADPTARARFSREARSAAAISHPNVVRVYGVGETAESGLPYIVMQYVEGSTLSEWVRKRGKVSEREARRVVGHVAAALDAAHRRGLVHRDIKPANILIEAESGHAYVADFGLTAALTAGDATETTRLTTPGVMLGTPVYMSPEQAGTKPVGPKSDLYSLGVVAYELLTGELPLTAGTVLGWAAAHLRDTPSSVSERRTEISADVARLVDRCLAKRPEDRPDAQEMARGLLPTLETEIEWPPPGLGPLHSRARTLARVALATAAAVLLVALALTFPPEVVGVDGNWWERFEALREVSGSALGVRSEVTEEAAGGRPWLWEGLLVVGLSAFGIGLVVLALLSRRVWTLLARSRRLGWRWWTLIDIAVDPDGRNGLLISGAREFASLPVPSRGEVLQARRIQVGAQLGAGLWVIAALGLWAWAVVAEAASLDGSGPVLGLPVWLLVVLPAGFVGGVGMAAGLRESRRVRPLPRRRAYAAPVAPLEADSGTEEVASWYASLPDGSSPASVSRGWLGPAIGGAWLGGTLVSLLVLVALAEVVGAALVAGRVVRRLGPDTAELVATLDRISVLDPLRAAREVAAAYLPGREPVGESTSVEWARRLMAHVAGPGSPPPYGQGATLLAGPGGSRLAAALRAAQSRLPADTARLVEELAQHPRTALFRRLAGAADVDLFAAALERPLTSYDSLGQLPQPGYPRLGEAGRANGWAAVLAVYRGQHDRAAARLGENAAFAEHLLRVPTEFAGRYAVIMLRELTLLPLAELEELRGNAERADELRAIAEQLHEHLIAEFWATGMAGLAANPENDSRLVEALRSPRLPPGYRVEGLNGGWRGFCANAREILSGPSSRRRSTVLVAAESMTSAGHALALGNLTAETWERRLKVSPAGSTWLGRAGERVGLGVWKRLQVCAAGS